MNNKTTELLEYGKIKEMGLAPRTPEVIIKHEEKFKTHPRDLRISNKIMGLNKNQEQVIGNGYGLPPSFKTSTDVEVFS